MDRRERGADFETCLRAAFEGFQSELWTALPGIVVSFDPTKQTCVVKSALTFKRQMPDGSYQPLEMPPLLDCPVFFPGGGGLALTLPMQAGDECLVVFASRCIDQWWQSGQVSAQVEVRMHDLSDGFVFAGFSSVPKVFTGLSTTAMALRNASGTIKVEVDLAGTLNLTAPAINLNGTLTINGTPFLAHHHGGVATGVGVSGGVV